MWTFFDKNRNNYNDKVNGFDSGFDNDLLKNE